MGGAGTGACATYQIRPEVPTRGCLHSKPKLDRLIKATGSYYFKPINGVLSNLTDSAGTHSRYGACDVEGDGYSKDELYRVGRLIRDEAMLAYPRLWSGNWHIHFADAACPNMAATLAAQFKLFDKGYDALVGNGPDLLGGYKHDLIMSVFNARPVLPTPVPAPAPVVKVDYSLPYTYRTGWFPYPGAQGKTYYGPSNQFYPWYSGKVAGGTNTGVGASGNLSGPWVRGHIQRIQKCVGTRVDAIYGVNTVSAVKAWQAKHGLNADGIVGPRTWAAMAQSHHQ